MRRLGFVSAFSLLALSALPFMGCSASRVEDFDEKLDSRIQQQLQNRQKVVQQNPLYSGLVKELEDGRSMLVAGNPNEAFVRFDGILQNSRYTNFPEYSFAKYYMAVALYEMGVDYGALLYFADIVQKEPLKIHTHESLRRAIAIAQKLKDDELILYLASSITPDKIPLSLREEFRYFIAKDVYEKGNLDKASELFAQIPHRNRLYLAAEYILGTIAVKKNDMKTAINHFRQILDTHSPVNYYEKKKIRELGALALGRIFYEEKNYPLAIVYYKKIDREGEFFPTALYESSWALFKLNKFNEALSTLHSLNSPFVDQVYFLKSLLLKGAIYLELCLYDDAVKTLSGLEGDFKGLKTSIDQFARQARSPQEYYPLLSSKKRNPDGSEKYAYEELFKLAAANRDFLGVHRYIRELNQEREILQTVKSPRAELLSKLLSQKANDLQTKASYLSGKKLLLTRRLIGDFENAKDIVRYEIVSAERKILQTRSLRLAPPVITGQDLIKPEFTDSLREELVWWDYDGEYWEDEMGYYLYNVQSRCKETAEVKKP